MIITKSTLAILQYINKKKTVSYKTIKRKFKKNADLKDILEKLAYKHFIIQVGGSFTNCGEPIEITDKTLFQLDDLGFAEVERQQFFNLEYFLSHIAIPVAVGILSSVITALLLA